MDYVPAAEVRVMVPASEIRVVDGDTIRLGRERIRIIGLDAPESGNLAKCDAERKLSALATMTFREMIEGKFIEIRRDGHDRYGRTPAHVSIRAFWEWPTRLVFWTCATRLTALMPREGEAVIVDKSLRSFRC